MTGKEPPPAALTGIRFWKMTGSGNDFVFIDGREGLPPGIDSAGSIGRLCSRTDGVGADGVVFVEKSAGAAFAIRYYNRDGSRGELCGNASLCSTSLSVRLGIAAATGFEFSTYVGAITARIRSDLPEIDLQPVLDLRADTGIPTARGERRIGFANTGVPHLVVEVEDAESVPLLERGKELRFHQSLAAGANVNFIERRGARWRMRTYERGVEAETLACGTGSVACTAVLNAWGEAPSGQVELLTSSGRILGVSLKASAGRLLPSLKGEGRVVFEGRLVDIA
jgi:diaminopimelate epimerase